MNPSSPLPPNDANIFDSELMLAQIGGDVTLAREIIASAMQDMPTYLANLEQSLQAGNPQETGRLVHTMKGLMGQVCAMQLAEKLRDLDRQLKDGGVLTAGEVSGLREDYARYCAAQADWKD